MLSTEGVGWASKRRKPGNLKRRVLIQLFATKGRRLSEWKPAKQVLRLSEIEWSKRVCSRYHYGFELLGSLPNFGQSMLAVSFQQDIRTLHILIEEPRRTTTTGKQEKKSPNGHIRPETDHQSLWDNVARRLHTRSFVNDVSFWSTASGQARSRIPSSLMTSRRWSFFIPSYIANALLQLSAGLLATLFVLRILGGPSHKIRLLVKPRWPAPTGT